ncbi:MAG TPA: HAMP domain-containing histidine kinase [Candidatus Copromorpha excrementigallinarum]|uniref:histidine kinase n=1 Tax=Candidatus Allocopromorpha excrementigallinarum TaxID=2840742 RepID=A0A9D1L691_9FIRM|nr:HAMP domain-containing histidine kinase [Candidatus Copromorpha excrementigallinarum]
MTDKEKATKKRKLASEVMESLLVSVIVGIFIFGLLYHLSMSISDKYFDYKDLEITGEQTGVFNMWVRNLCATAAITVFLSLFLFLLGQKLAYVRSIIEGVEMLRTRELDFIIEPEGNNELTELAETINRMVKAQRELKAREEAVKEEREDMVRAISHDIRTPLTSIIAYSEYMNTKAGFTDEEIREYISLVKEKSDHITHMTDRLLDSRPREKDIVEDGRLLMGQLSGEWEAVLEDGFKYSVDMLLPERFSVEVNIQDLKRIFDNLASNVKKYADPEKPVYMRLESDGKYIRLFQKNSRRKQTESVRSHGIGLKNIEKIADFHGGDIKVGGQGDAFEITVRLKIIYDL